MAAMMEERCYPNRCLTCASCDVECPINIRTGKLFPRSLVRKFVLGMDKELIEDTSIWFCIQCDRCTRVCPMDVKPSRVIRNAQNQAMIRGIVEKGFPEVVASLKKRLQIARRIAAYEIFYLGTTPAWENIWENADKSHLALNSIQDMAVMDVNRLGMVNAYRFYLGNETAVTSCWACGSCTNACPISISSDVFSPMVLIRTANWGLASAIARRDEPWLCIGCERCLDACPQGVRGAWIIHVMQDTAVRQKEISYETYLAWKTLDGELHRIFIRSVAEVHRKQGNVAMT